MISIKYIFPVAGFTNKNKGIVLEDPPPDAYITYDTKLLISSYMPTTCFFPLRKLLKSYVVLPFKTTFRCHSPVTSAPRYKIYKS
jgi:hypothetical protein